MPAKKTFTEDQLTTAALDILQGKISDRKVAQKTGIGRQLLRRKVKELKGVYKKKERGRKLILKDEEEKSLVKVVKEMADSGFAPTAQQVKSFVSEYAVIHDIKNPNYKPTATPSKRRSKKKVWFPSRSWLRRFLKRNNLSQKRTKGMHIEMNEPEEPVTPTLEVDNEPVEYPDTAQFPKPKNRGGNSCEGSWVWIPKGQPKTTSSTPILSETQSPSSFLDIIAGRFSQTRASRLSQRGKRVPMTATHVTCQSSIPVVEYEEASTSAETSQQTSKRPQRGSKRKLIYTSSRDDDDDDDDDDEVTDEDDNIEIQEHISKIKIALNSENWREIIAEKLFAVHFDDPFKFYIGRLKNVFSEDENSNINKVVFKFLDFRGAGRWVAKPSADLETVPATSIFYGPIPHSLAVGNAIKLENDVQGRIRTLWNQFTRVFRKH